METRTNVTIPKFRLKTPANTVFWKAVGIEIVKDIGKRTRRGSDADNRPFKTYTKQTIKQRSKRGRSSRVNLTDTGKMLGSMSQGIRPSKSGVKIQLSGEQGFKAFNIQKNQRRVFFALNRNQVIRIIRRINKWMVEKNK